ncbi:MAG: type II toxin-antitoxin system RelE/ParE family toxin [Sulfuricellaceae bacterium]|nr:type II toxin-antitoxin system RelE/ParE family toxin [Sulfuricellaceae bacterium]
MFTVIETPTFQRLWPHYWTEEERGEFAAFIAQNPDAGDVVKNSGGVRKVRWSRSGSGKSAGVRVIYFNKPANGQVWLLFLYAKSTLDSMAGHKLKELKDAIEKTFV